MTPVPPGPAVTCSRGGFGVHLRSLRAGVSALPGPGSCLPLPAGFCVPAELLCPGPAAVSCHKAFINRPFRLR